MHSPRVFLGLSDIGGYYQQLERGLLAEGVRCTYVNAFPGPSRFGRTTRPDALGRMVEWLGQRRVAHPPGSLLRMLWMVVQAVSLVIYALATLPRYDVYVFASGDSFLRGRDLPFLRLLGKRVIAIFHGTDSRPPYLNAAYVGTEGAVDPAAWIAGSRSLKKEVRRVEDNVDVCIQHALSGHFHERPFVNWLEIGIPSASNLECAEPPRDWSRCVIVHAPTRPGPKGTPLIERAVASLQQRGFAVELVKIIGRPNHEVLEAIAASDFVVDELYSDTTMASFATEAAMLGRVAIVGMEDFDALRRSCTEESIPPAFVCRASEVEVAIETLLADRDLRFALGQRASSFVRDRWSASSVARRFLRVIDDDIPPEWWFDPGRIDYLHGWGLKVERLREVLRAIIATGGVEALQVADKPELERAFAALAGSGGDSDA